MVSKNKEKGSEKEQKATGGKAKIATTMEKETERKQKKILLERKMDRNKRENKLTTCVNKWRKSSLIQTQAIK